MQSSLRLDLRQLLKLITKFQKHQQQMKRSNDHIPHYLHNHHQPHQQHLYNEMHCEFKEIQHKMKLVYNKLNEIQTQLMANDEQSDKNSNGIEMEWLKNSSLRQQFKDQLNELKNLNDCNNWDNLQHSMDRFVGNDIEIIGEGNETPGNRNNSPIQKDSAKEQGSANNNERRGIIYLVIRVFKA